MANLTTTPEDDAAFFQKTRDRIAAIKKGPPAPLAALDDQSNLGPKEVSDDDLISAFGGAAKPAASVGTPDSPLRSPQGTEDTLTIDVKPNNRKKKDLTDDDLIAAFGTAPVSQTAAPVDATPNAIVDAAKNAGDDTTGVSARTGVGLLRGAKDVIDTGAHALLRGQRFVGEQLGGDIGNALINHANTSMGEDVVAAKQFDQRLGDSTAASIGRVAGQIGATAPLIPSAGITGVSNALFNAAPRLTAAGTEVAAPLLSRAASALTQGAASGAAFGAGTASTAAPDQSTGSYIGQNALLGAAAAPVVAAASKAAGGVINAGKSLWANYGPGGINALARNAGIEPSVAKNIVARLDDAGISPADAQNALMRMGPKATIADLDPALTAEARGVAQLGGKPTSILDSAYATRAAGANNEAHQIMESTLGAKPDVEGIKQGIKTAAQNGTRSDYQLAYAHNKPVDVSDVATGIDASLTKAAGKTESALNDAKSYLYGKDGQLKTDVESLHNARIELDDMLNRMPQEGSSSASSAYRAVENVRNNLDKELKKVPGMSEADTKYAKAMSIREAVDLGSNWQKNNAEAFAKSFADATPLEQQAIRVGMRGKLGDLMEAASRGELPEAQRLFSKASANRAKFQTAFGKDADTVLDALKNEAAQRATEQAVMHGSKTGVNQAIRPRYMPGENNPLTADLLTGAAGDLMGGGGAVTSGMIGRRVVGGTINKLTSRAAANERLSTGTADLLSQQGGNVQNTLAALARIKGRIPDLNPLSVNYASPIAAPVGRGLVNNGPAAANLLMVPLSHLMPNSNR